MISEEQALFNRFQEAIRDGTNEQVCACLRTEGFPFDFVSPTGRRPSHLICERGALEPMQLLCDLHPACDLAAVDNKRASPLHYAAKSGHVRLVELLLSLGAAPSGLAEGAGETPADTAFHWAVWSTRLDVARVLHACDASLVNRQDKEGETALHWAVFNNRLSITRQLVRDFDATTNALNAQGSTPLHFAVEYSELEIVRFLVEDAGVAVNPRDMHGDTPLHVAVSFENAPVVALLLQREDVDPCPVNENGQTPLDVAEDLHVGGGIQALLEAAAHGQDSLGEALERQKKVDEMAERTQKAVDCVRRAGGY